MIYLNKIALYNFRNYKQLEVHFDQRPTVLYGPNGAGKTNLLEAISLFAVGTGMRDAKLQDLVHSDTQTYDDTTYWAVNAMLDENITLSTGYQNRRIFKIQGIPVKSAAKFHEYIQLVHITPDMDHLFTNPASDRRRFVDKLITSYDPLHAENISIYEKATHQRLKLLKASSHQDNRWMDALENIIARQNVKISNARITLMNKLIDGQKKHIPMFPKFLCKMVGKIEDILHDTTDGKGTIIKERLKQNREIDRMSGMTVLGCHRSDFEVIHDANKRLARECSTGEQKILLISIVLSFVHQKIESIDNSLVLLLDDVIARLDWRHRMVLFEQIGSFNQNSDCAFVQTFFSGTDSNLFEPLKCAQLFEVKDAIVVQQNK
ncbi:MAG: DNA replication/repair protein RecF [Holosporales bacterium]|jgi:DNA replication and repair protein RecF|nr:DNA replication/repair protein RecF [Holosporales bacterium]